MHQDPAETESYLHNLLSLNSQSVFDQFKLFTNLEKKELQQVRKNIFQTMTSFIEATIREIEFVIEEKLQLVHQQNAIFVFGEITKISGIEDYLTKLETKYD